MITLSAVIHDLPSNTLEATWAERIQLPDEWQDTPIKCHSYSIEQKDMFLADCAALCTPAEASDFADVCTAWLVEANNVNPFAAPPPSPAELVRAQIAAIEATITPRRLREAVLSSAGKDWLDFKDAQIAALRASL